MKKSKLVIITALSLILATVSVGTGFAQSSDIITAKVDRSAINSDEVLVLTVTVNAKSSLSGRPALPTLDGFQVVGSNSSTQITLVNGDMSVREVFQYQLRPTHIGNLTIGPVAATVNGQTYSTAPITINVTQGTGQLQPPPGSSQPALPNFPNLNLPSLPGFGSLPADPFDSPVPVDPSAPPQGLVGREVFVEAEVDNLTPYQGEQVIFTFRFYKASNSFGLLEQPEYQAPDFSGFWHELQPEHGDYRVQAGGHTYRVTQMQTVLFPTMVGEIAIDPATLNIPGGFFSRGQVMHTEPIILNVQPLPAGAPADFQGAVGRFSIQAETDKLATQVNDTITMRVTLKGLGNIETVPDPIWSESADWRAFDSQADTDARFENDIMGGTKTYSRVLVPTRAGNATLPAVQFSFFDPETGTYHTIGTDPIAITVAPDGSVAAPTFPTANTGSVNALPGPGDIRPLKPAATSWSVDGSSLAGKTGYWLLWIVPLLVVGGQLAWQQRKKHMRNNVATRRSQKAAKLARRALKQASKNPAQAHSVAGQILTDYIATKLNRSVTGLTQTELADILVTHGIGSTLVERVQLCLMLSEMGRYAPEDLGGGNTDILVETSSLIGELEKEF